MDIRDLINNEDGRPSYPKDTMLVANNGSGTDSGVSDEQIQEILSRLTTLEVKKDKYTSFVTEYKLMGSVHGETGETVEASNPYATYGVSLGNIFSDKTGEHPSVITKLTYYSPSFTFGGVKITDGDASKAYDIHIPALAFDIPLYEPYGYASSSQVIVIVTRQNGHSPINDHREIRVAVNATIEYEILGEDLASGGYINNVTPQHRVFAVHGINFFIDILNKTSDDVVHKASIMTEFGFSTGSGHGSLGNPTTNTTPTRYNCDFQDSEASFTSVLENGAGASNCVRLIHTKLNEI